VPRRNRVDPWGDLHAAHSRGLFTGNRGCLVDDAGEVVRHHRSSLWIVCLTSYRGWRWPLADPGRWTPIFFLDDAAALAAGHRPCGLCRRDDHRSYRDAVTAAEGLVQPLKAVDLDRRLTVERLRRGRGIDRRGDRLLWTADIDDLPDGTVVLDADVHPHVVVAEQLLRFTFDGWDRPRPRPTKRTVRVLTPPTSVAALARGYRPRLHPSAGASGNG
jgi:hypothetical protein